MQLNAELLAWFQSHAPRVGLSDQEVAIPMDPGSEVGMAPSAQVGGHAAGGKGVTLGSNKGSVETLFEHPATGTHITAGTGDLVFWTIAQRTGLVQQVLALQRSRRRQPMAVRRAVGLSVRLVGDAGDAGG